ncbi:MAG: DUF3862 domain-containing protein [Propionivibrio sp.]|uniref:hypothetical protein n=1 Tax=Propionivibrio sp. TaxID=2212460 RepID=UPI001A3F7D83|nr:hypothetical protein [Propionivibrio sp.]MBL8413960.1 DUF3862 domain-containing protein [Propionivibrio sp.]
MRLIPLRRIPGLFLSSLLLAACGSQLSLENYNKLKVGQSYEDVRKIIGEPARCDEMLGIRTCIWGEEKQGITINFVAGQVMLLSATNIK